jgi:hypothetical protein
MLDAGRTLGCREAGGLSSPANPLVRSLQAAAFVSSDGCLPPEGHVEVRQARCLIRQPVGVAPSPRASSLSAE